MKKTLFLFLFISFTVSSVYAQSDDLKAQIEEINKVIVEATLNNTPEKILEYYAEDPVSLPSYMPMIVGMDELKKVSEEQKQMPMKWLSFELHSKYVWDYGDVVVDIGTYNYEMEIPMMPEPFSDNGKYLTVYEKQEDGSLKMKADTWNTDTNPWEMMAPPPPPEGQAPPPPPEE